MKKHVFFALFAASLCLSVLTQPLAATEKEAPNIQPSISVTSEMLKSKIEEVEAATNLQAEAKNQLIELYRQSLSNLNEVNANTARAKAFEEATRTAPAQTQVIREQIETAKYTDPMDTLDIGPDTPLAQIEQQLQKEQANLAAVDARRADFERRLTYQRNRPATISQRLAEAKQQQEKIAATLGLPPVADTRPTLRLARRWVLETQYAALSTEIRMLDQELLSQSMRLGLLEAEQAQEAASVQWIGARVKALGEWVNRQRERAAEQAKAEATETQLETAGFPPLLVHLAERNAELTDELHVMAARLPTLDREQAQAEQLAARIAMDFKDAADTLETGGLAEGLGQILAKQRKSLPDFQRYALKAQTRKQQIAEMGVWRLHHAEEARRIADLEQTVAELVAQVSIEKTPLLRSKIRDLVTKRQTLLDKALDDHKFYLRQLLELDAAEHKLLGVTGDFNNFLNEHLFWLRTSEQTRLEDLGKLGEEVRRLLSPAIWSQLAQVFWHQVTHSPVFGLVLLAVIALLWKRRTLIAAIRTTTERLGKPTTDRFSQTWRALGLTLMVAAPLPLLMATAGWQLLEAALGSDLVHAMGFSLLRVALHLYILRGLRMMCIPRGLAAHFRWPESSVGLLRIELDRLTWFYVPAGLIVLLTMALNPADTGDILARLGFLVFCVALARFLYCVLHPRRGVLTQLRLRHATGGILFRAYPFWFPLLCAFPLAPALMALTGYVYSAAALANLFLHTLWMIAGLVVLHALALRWLLIVHRRLSYEAAVERRRATLAAKQIEESETESEESDALQFEEPEVNLAALSDASRELLKFTIIAAALAGLYMIWSPLLPALRIFDDVILWYQTVTVDGEGKRLPITLSNLGLALIYVIGMMVLVKRLPAVLEIILLQRFDMSSGSRYTATTLSTYAIVAVGLLLVLNTLGAQWSQLQWLVAALSVGIGFGLQEIVANFISGLIILFERPIRVGDIVTVGDTDGVVTKIRIRATTIRNWDRKELVVPNKEFITGRLLNWCLSDSITRAVIAVGVAYGSDVDRALALMKEAAEEQEHVIDDPAPILTFEGFGDNALTLNLRVYIDSIDYRLATITALHKAINRKFEQAGIVIAFPQRDLHLDTNGPLRIRIEDARREKRDGRNEGPVEE